MLDLIHSAVLLAAVTPEELTAVEAAQTLKIILITFIIFLSLVILNILLHWFVRSGEYDSLTHARELIRLNGRNLTDKQLNEVGYALMISAERNSKRGNNVCQALARAFHSMANSFYEKKTAEITDKDLELIIEHIHYWEWSKGEGKGIKLIFPES